MTPQNSKAHTHAHTKLVGFHVICVVWIQHYADTITTCFPQHSLICLKLLLYEHHILLLMSSIIASFSAVQTTHRLASCDVALQGVHLTSRQEILDSQYPHRALQLPGSYISQYLVGQSVSCVRRHGYPLTRTSTELKDHFSTCTFFQRSFILFKISQAVMGCSLK